MPHAALIGLLALLNAGTISNLPSPACLSDAQLIDGTTVIMPVLVHAVGAQCAAVLPKGSLLSDPASPFVAKLDAAAAEAWPRMRSIAASLFAGTGLPVPKDVSTFTQARFVAQISPSLGQIVTDRTSCAPADRMLHLLAPLPPRDLAALVIQIALMVPEARRQLACIPE